MIHHFRRSLKQQIKNIFLFAARWHRKKFSPGRCAANKAIIFLALFCVALGRVLQIFGMSLLRFYFFSIFSFSFRGSGRRSKWRCWRRYRCWCCSSLASIWLKQNVGWGGAGGWVVSVIFLFGQEFLQGVPNIDYDVGSGRYIFWPSKKSWPYRKTGCRKSHDPVVKLAVEKVMTLS